MMVKGMKILGKMMAWSKLMVLRRLIILLKRSNGNFKKSYDPEKKCDL